MINPIEQQCPQCGEKVDIMPPNPMFDWPTFTTSVTTTAFDPSDFSGSVTQPPVETKRTYKCVNPKCWVTKIRVEWE